MAAKKKDKSKAGKTTDPVIQNRRARHDYTIDETLECGIKLLGTEVKSVRNGQVSLAEGYVRASDAPIALELYGVHIAEYPPAGEKNQHNPIRMRVLLASRREIRKFAERSRERGLTIVPLKMYFVRGRAKIEIGLARGKTHRDKRQDLTKREAKREMDRAMSTRGALTVSRLPSRTPSPPERPVRHRP